jgi:hypothetical protein
MDQLSRKPAKAVSGSPEDLDENKGICSNLKIVFGYRTISSKKTNHRTWPVCNSTEDLFAKETRCITATGMTFFQFLVFKEFTIV